MSKIKEYPKGEKFAVIWEASKCAHAGVCVRTLPKVYKPNDRPWINPEFATVEELKKQIDACPSGALSYKK